MTNVIAVRFIPPPFVPSGPGPSAMFAGPVSSDRIRIDWWPSQDQNIIPPPVDPNKYSIWRATGPGQAFSAASKLAGADVSLGTGVVPKPGPGGSTFLFYYYTDLAVVAGQAYTYYVTAVNSTTGVESNPGPALTMTTLAGSATPPTTPAAVADPATWITPFSLPVGGTTYTPVDGPALSTALAAAIPGDIIVLTAGSTYQAPAAGFIPPAYAGAGWVYVISSEDPVLNNGGKLPPYVDYTTPTLPVARTLTGAPGIGATSATLSSNWTQKTGIYPVQFFNATAGSNAHEQRYVLFTKNSTAIKWDVTSTGTRNPCGMTGSVGPGLSYAVTNTIAVVYLPGVTLYDYDNGAFPIISFGGVGTNGFGFVLPAPVNNVPISNVRFVGIAFQTKATNPTDNGHFQNFAALQLAKSTNIYVDRCLIGAETSGLTTSGPPDWTVTAPNTFGFLTRGIGNGNCNNLLIHQSYIQGCVQTTSIPGQDSQGINILGGGPIAIQYNHIEAESEGVLFGGSFVAQNNNPHDITYRGNFNTKLQWWLANTQNMLAPFTLNTTTLTGNGTVGPYGTFNATLQRSERWLVTVNGAVQDPTAYTIQVNKPNTTNTGTITFKVVIAASAVITVRGQAEFYFADNIKNHFEMKAAIGANCYGNTHWNCWYSNQAGYRGSSWSPGCRDQQANGLPTGTFASNIFHTCPWVTLTDIDIHDNVSWAVGQGVNMFGGADHGPTQETTRVRIKNEQFWLHSPIQAAVEPIYRSNLWMTLPGGLLTNIIWDNITVIQDPTNGGVPNATASFYGSPPPRLDRWTISDSIFPGINAFSGDSTYRLNNVQITNPAYAGWTNNLTITDITGPFGTGVTYKGVTYANIGFAHFVDNFRPPTQPSDWNVTVSNTACGGASCTVASTTAGPIGATF